MRYSRRRYDESKFEYFKRRVRRASPDARHAVAAGASLLVMTLGIIGIAELTKDDTSKADKGTARVGRCAYTAGRLAIKDPFQPKTTAPGEKLPKGSGPYFDRMFLDSAINQLAAAAPRSVGNNRPLTSFSNNDAYALRLIAAEDDVFYTQTNGITTERTFEIDNPETKLDDDSEVFCRDDGKVYLTPQAAQAITDMASAGINIDPHLSAAIK